MASGKDGGCANLLDPVRTKCHDAYTLGMDTWGELIHASQLSRRQRSNLSAAGKNGSVLRLADGVYINNELWNDLSNRDRLVAQAVALTSRRNHSAARGVTAVACHGHPIPIGRHCPQFFYAADLAKRTRPYQTQMVSTRFGIARALSLFDAIIDVGTTHGPLASLMAAEHHVHQQPNDLPLIRDALSGTRDLPGSRQLRTLSSLLTTTSESPRETELKYALWQEGFEPPLAQATISMPNGRFIARPDFFFKDQAVAVEYDGVEKHTGAYGLNVNESLLRERERERQLINLGIRVIRFDRVTFSDGSAMAALRYALSAPRNAWSSRVYWIKGGIPAWQGPHSRSAHRYPPPSDLPARHPDSMPITRLGNQNHNEQP